MSKMKKSGLAYPPHILLAEDDMEMRSILMLMLRKKGYRVTECSDGIEMCNHLSSFFIGEETSDNIDLIISDIRMPGITGMDVLIKAHKRDTFPPIILITAFGDEETHTEAIRYGAEAIFDKPFAIEDLLEKVGEVISFPNLSSSVEKKTKDRLETIDAGKRDIIKMCGTKDYPPCS